MSREEMTREEAIKIIKELPNRILGITLPFDTDFDYTEALSMAIKALEQEPCEDCISRKSIKQKLQEHHDFFVNAYGRFSNLPQNDKSRVDEITNCIAMVVNEPSVNPQPCEDAISRDELLKAIDTWDKFGCDADTKLVRYQDHYVPYIHYDDVIKCIKGMPPVKPQEPKIGHWIEDDMTYCGVDLTNYKCDKCGEIGGSWRKGLKPDKLPKYCMNCGAKMVEPQERSDKE